VVIGDSVMEFMYACALMNYALISVILLRPYMQL